MFDELSLEALHARRSAKWSVFPPDVLPAWVAEMDFPLAVPVRDALRAAIDRDDCGYANPAGLPEAYAAFAESWFGWTVDPARLSLVPDVLVGIVETLRLVTAPGDRVVINPPIYPPFYTVLAEVGRTVERVPLLRHDDGRYDLDLAGLERAFAAGARAYLLCSPHNPVGRVFPKDDLIAVAELAQRYGVIVLADEVHAPLALAGATHTPFLTVSEPLGCDAIALVSASKAWNLAGLKCALIVAGSDRMRGALRAMPPEVRWRAGHLGVLAAIAAFHDGSGWLTELLAHLDRNRGLLLELVCAHLPGVVYVPPEASYLAWLDVGALGLGDDPVKVFLDRGRVALTRGRDYGPEGAAFVRVNMGTSAAILTEVVARMRTALG